MNHDDMVTVIIIIVIIDGVSFTVNIVKSFHIAKHDMANGSFLSSLSPYSTISLTSNVFGDIVILLIEFSN